jgi:hypothetical protein
MRKWLASFDWINILMAIVLIFMGGFVLKECDDFFSKRSACTNTCEPKK